jgi:hypothetical protein
MSLLYSDDLGRQVYFDAGICYMTTPLSRIRVSFVLSSQVIEILARMIKRPPAMASCQINKQRWPFSFRVFGCSSGRAFLHAARCTGLHCGICIWVLLFLFLFYKNTKHYVLPTVYDSFTANPTSTSVHKAKEWRASKN